MNWFMDMLKRRVDALLGTRVITAGIGIGISLLLPNLSAELRAELVTAIVIIFNVMRAYQNTKTVAAEQAAKAAIEAARIASGAPVVPVKESLEQFITRLTAEGKSPSEIAAAWQSK